MRKWLPHLVGVIGVAAGVLARPFGGAASCPTDGMVPAGAETCTLELKRLEPPGQSGVVSPDMAGSYVYRATSPQHFFMQLGISRPDNGTKEFSAVVKKEPEKYQSEHPFRGVAKLGSGQYAFVLDAKDEKSTGYDRLYFDLNHNGDLTDDKALDAIVPANRRVVLPANYSQHQFPRVDLTIDADGTKVDYAFFFSVYSQTLAVSTGSDGKESEAVRYVSASLNSAAYREGQITLDGKPRRVVLIDFNSNGRFDDQLKINEEVRTANGQLYPETGDRLLVDFDPRRSGYRSPYDVTTSSDQHDLSSLVNIDGRFYDLEVSAAGDKLTLASSPVPLGYVTNPNDGFRAMVYGEKGFLKISGEKSKPIPLPEGDWKLLTYTIDQTGYEKPKEEPVEEKKQPSLLQSLANALVGSTGLDGSAISGPRYTLASAQATADYKAVQVRKGQTVVMPFGPPFKPVVKASVPAGTRLPTVPLALSLIGSGGEVCTNLMVDGDRPAKPEFTISTPDGKEIASGEFEYG